jgi:protein-tyrosine phosphatase
MIDLHCHLLPGIDDGPETLAEALGLARVAVADGITTAVLTPHIHPGRYGNSLSTVVKAVAAFQLTLREKEIPLKVYAGGEVRVGMEALDLLADGEMPFLGSYQGYRVALIEFPHQGIPVGASQFLAKMLDLKIRPLIAHPERNRSIMLAPERVRQFVEMGCLLQLTASAITGNFGEPARKAAHYLLEQDMAWLVATDAHNVEHRPPVMSKARDMIAAMYGGKRAQLLVHDRAEQILAEAV